MLQESTELPKTTFDTSPIKISLTPETIQRFCDEAEKETVTPEYLMCGVLDLYVQQSGTVSIARGGNSNSLKRQNSMQKSPAADRSEITLSLSQTTIQFFQKVADTSSVTPESLMRVLLITYANQQFGQVSVSEGCNGSR